MHQNIVKQYSTYLNQKIVLYNSQSINIRIGIIDSGFRYDGDSSFYVAYKQRSLTSRRVAPSQEALEPKFTWLQAPVDGTTGLDGLLRTVDVTLSGTYLINADTFIYSIIMQVIINLKICRVR